VGCGRACKLHALWETTKNISFMCLKIAGVLVETTGPLSSLFFVFLGFKVYSPNKKVLILKKAYYVTIFPFFSEFKN
jgi:hypothetical protein